MGSDEQRARRSVEHQVPDGSVGHASARARPLRAVVGGPVDTLAVGAHVEEPRRDRIDRDDGDTDPRSGRSELLPRRSAVGAAKDASGLRSRVHAARVVRIDGDGADVAGADPLVRLAPVLASVGAAEHAAGVGRREEVRGRARVDRQREQGVLVESGAGGPPRRARIEALEEPARGRGVHRARVRRIECERRDEPALALEDEAGARVLCSGGMLLRKARPESPARPSLRASWRRHSDDAGTSGQSGPRRRDRL